MKMCYGPWSRRALLVTKACGPTACAELLAQLLVSVLARIEDYSLNYLCMIAHLSKCTRSKPQMQYSHAFFVKEIMQRQL